MAAFDEDTAARKIGTGRYRVGISGRWNVFGVPNGGYLLAAALAAVEAELPASEPLTATAHYLRPGEPDRPAEVAVEVIRVGRTFQTASASLAQDGKERLRMLARRHRTDRHGPPVRVPGPDSSPAGLLE